MMKLNILVLVTLANSLLLDGYMLRNQGKIISRNIRESVNSKLFAETKKSTELEQY